MIIPNDQKAAASCQLVKFKLSEAICALDEACGSLEYVCRQMDWDEGPCFDIRDAMRCAGLALAKMLEWEREDLEKGGAK